MNITFRSMNRQMIGPACARFFCALAGALVACSAQGQSLLNMDFAAHADRPKIGLAATGNGPSDIWNASHRPFVRDYTESNLVWADGTPSPVSISVENAGGAWSNQAADPMYSAYIYPSHTGSMTLRVKYLPEGTYDFYLYGHGGPGTHDQNSFYSAQTLGVTYGPLATTTGRGWTSPFWKEGDQYVVLRDITVGADEVTVTVAPGASHHAIIAGMQIVNTCSLLPKQGARLVQANLGETVQFSARPVTSSSPVSYQWRFGSSDIPGATSSNLTIQALSANQAGFYSVVLSNEVCMAEHRYFLDFKFLTVGYKPSFALEVPPNTQWEVQFAEALGGSWSSLTNITPAVRPHEFFDPAITNTPARFYRVVPSPAIP